MIGRSGSERRIRVPLFIGERDIVLTLPFDSLAGPTVACGHTDFRPAG